MKQYTLSAYNAIPLDVNQRDEFYAALAAFEWISGLELSFSGTVEWPAAGRDDWESLVTMVGHNMQMVEQNPNYGLASPDADARQAALADHELALAQVQRLNAAGHRIRAIEIHSAPTRFADPHSYAQSLAEIVSWDWGTTQVWAEHCDAWVDGQDPAKGYLRLEDEIAVLDRVGAKTGTGRLGLVINWARSAIEGRDPDFALQQVKIAASSSWLRHLGVSGACSQQSDYGTAWADAHVPPAGTSCAPDGAVLTAQRIAEALAAKGEASTGLKFTLQPSTLNAAQRIALLNQIAHLVDAQH